MRATPVVRENLDRLDSRGVPEEIQRIWVLVAARGPLIQQTVRAGIPDKDTPIPADVCSKLAEADGVWLGSEPVVVMKPAAHRDFKGPMSMLNLT